jgi:hypothetical protein
MRALVLCAMGGGMACGGETASQGAAGDPGGCASTGVPVTLVAPVDPSVLGTPGGVVVEGGRVIWGWGGGGDDSGTVSMLASCGGAPTTVASGQSSLSAIAADATNVYWVNGFEAGSVLAAPLGGGATTTLAAGLDSPVAVAVDATSVYWTNGGNDKGGSIQKVALSGGSPVTLVPADTGPQAMPFGGIAVDATSVYWASAGGWIEKVPLGGGTPTTLAQAPTGPDSVATFVVVAGTLYCYALDAIDEIVPLLSVPVDGSAPASVLGGVRNSAVGLAVDGSSVYWMELSCPTTDPGTQACAWSLQKLTIATGAETTLVAGLQSSPSALAVDDTSVTWVNADGSVMRVSPK